MMVCSGIQSGMGSAPSFARSHRSPSSSSMFGGVKTKGPGMPRTCLRQPQDLLSSRRPWPLAPGSFLGLYIGVSGDSGQRPIPSEPHLAGTGERGLGDVHVHRVVAVGVESLAVNQED